MKITQNQKKANRKAIIRATAELIAEDGFKATTMRKIAKAAGVGDATIYNYFPTKEAILYGYYHDHMQDCVEALKSVPDFNTFILQEQLQTFFDTSLNLYLPDRDFIDQTFRLVLLGTSRDWARIKPIRALFLDAVNHMLATAMETGEIPDQVFEELIGQFFLDAYIGAVHYWLSDTSDRFNNTNIIIDRGLNLACALLKAGVANKFFDIALFLFKTHILSKMEFLIDPLKSAHPGPVMLFEPKLLSAEWLEFLGRGGRDTVIYDVPADGARGNVTSGEAVPFGEAALRREGEDVTIVSVGVGVHRALEAAERLASEGIECEVTDLRSLRPLDHIAIEESVRRTNRLVVVDEDYLSYGLSGEVAAVALEAGLTPKYARVCLEDTLPYARHLEDAALPNVGRILHAVKGLV